MTKTPIAQRFAYHPPSSDEVVAVHQEVRGICRTAAELLSALLPICRETELAIEALDLACMHANSAIARTQLHGPVADPSE